MKLSFASGPEHYLTTVHRLGNNTTVKYIEILKRVLKAAVEQEWISSDPLVAFKCRYHESNRERLTMDKIVMLYKKDFNLARLEEVRDLLILLFHRFCLPGCFSINH
jgi:hypothetical protein